MPDYKKPMGHRTPRTMTPDELKAYANDLMGKMRAEHNARMAAGPEVGPGVPNRMQAPANPAARYAAQNANPPPMRRATLADIGEGHVASYVNGMPIEDYARSRGVEFKRRPASGGVMGKASGMQASRVTPHDVYGGDVTVNEPKATNLYNPFPEAQVSYKDMTPEQRAVEDKKEMEMRAKLRPAYDRAAGPVSKYVPSPGVYLDLKRKADTMSDKELAEQAKRDERNVRNMSAIPGIGTVYSAANVANAAHMGFANMPLVAGLSPHDIAQAPVDFSKKYTVMGGKIGMQDLSNKAQYETDKSMLEDELKKTRELLKKGGGAIDLDDPEATK